MGGTHFFPESGGEHRDARPACGRRGRTNLFFKPNEPELSGLAEGPIKFKITVQFAEGRRLVVE